MSSRLIVVDSPDDERLSQFRLREREMRPRHLPQRVIKGRRPEDLERIQSGMFVAEGDLVVERSLDAGCIMVVALVDADAPTPLIERISSDVPIFAAAREARRILTGLGVALDIMAIFERPELASFDDCIATAKRAIVVEDVDNPTNIGAIVRSATAFGVDTLILDRNSSDPLARRALRVSMGTALKLPTCRVDNVIETLGGLRESGFVICALTPSETAVDIRSVETSIRSGDKVAILMGSERTGLSTEALSLATHRIRIPMAEGVDSLNVASAAAVATYALLVR
jgi:tRNA G18 (ribose-2'-O)-methylase SpoU